MTKLHKNINSLFSMDLNSGIYTKHD